jgi:hypothetical protein
VCADLEVSRQTGSTVREKAVSTWGELTAFIFVMQTVSLFRIAESKKKRSSHCGEVMDHV